MNFYYKVVLQHLWKLKDNIAYLEKKVVVFFK